MEYRLGMAQVKEAQSKIRTRVRTEALQTVLARRSISQTQLAEMLRVSPAAVSKLVRGVRDPRSGLRQRLMTVLGLGFDDLFEIVRRDGAKR